MKTLFLYFITCSTLFFPNFLEANFQIVEVFPNTQNDADLEYVTVKNTGEEALSLFGYTIADFKKEYTVKQEIIVESGDTYIFERSETKITLNNYNETVFLYDSEKNLVDSKSYETSVKGGVIYFESLKEEIDNEIKEEENIGKSEADEQSVEEKSEELEDNSVSEEVSGSGTNVDENEIQEGEIDENNLGEENTGISDAEVMREIILELQRPSYIYESETKNTFYCESGREECKINFNLENSFHNDFKKSDHTCRVEFAGYADSEESKCNPNTVIVPEGETEVMFQILSKDSSKIVLEKVITIIFDRSIKTPETTIKNSEPKLGLITPKIIVQSGLEGFGTNFYCTKHPCKFNLNYEKIHKGEACFWNFGPGTSKSMTTRERCNPGYVTIEHHGIFELSLRIYEKAYPSNQKVLTYYIHTFEEEVTEEENIIDELQSIEVIEEYEEVDNELKETEIIKEILTPEIVLQGKLSKEKTLLGSTLNCNNVEKCFVNLTASGFTESKNHNYIWMLGEETLSEKYNPKGFWLETGNHEIMFTASGETIATSQASFLVEVTGKLQSSVKNISKNTIREPKLFEEIEEKTYSENILPKNSFTQNYLVLKYDGLRISGKAPLGSSIQVFFEDKLIVEGSTDEKGKYRLVSKDFEAGEYNFLTKLVLENDEIVELSSTKTAIIEESDIALWKQGKASKKKSSKSSSISTSNYIPKPKYFRISEQIQNPEIIAKQAEISFKEHIFLLFITFLGALLAGLHLFSLQSSNIKKIVISIDEYIQDHNKRILAIL